MLPLVHGRGVHYFSKGYDCICAIRESIPLVELATEYFSEYWIDKSGNALKFKELEA